MIVIACSKNWNESLNHDLQKKINTEIAFISEKKQLTSAYLAALNDDIKYIFFPYWSYLIPTEIYETYSCVIFHMTDVPFGRGGSPLQNLIARDIYETKISALKCIRELDAGPVYLKHLLSLYGNAREIYHRANQIMIEMIVEIFKNNLTPVKQEGNIVNFLRRTPPESNIFSLTELYKIHDYIRMLDADDYPKAFIENELFKFEFSRSSFDGKEIIADVKITRKGDKSE